MKIALISAPFQNGRTDENAADMIRYIREAAACGAELAVFGESALQGFDALTWDYEKDLQIACDIKSACVCRLCDAAQENGIAISFGMIEKDGDSLYSTQLTVDQQGQVLHRFRRVSPGWKTESASAFYREGEAFTPFDLNGKRFSCALCGDLWYDENVQSVDALKADFVLWPVYCDYSADEWNEKAKYEYAEQAGKVTSKVLWVNPYCADGCEAELARGGAAVFEHGRILQEMPSGAPGMLICEI
ncbi:MAG: carbon-nitrogen hydrolase family protein [Clostridiales bacterium]|nr:carbon-nitrogen hydrolase family protein [Clostridiales bacterium]